MVLSLWRDSEIVGLFHSKFDFSNNEKKKKNKNKKKKSFQKNLYQKLHSPV